MPWRELMAFGFGVLRLAPDHFWQLSVPEAAAAWRAVYGAQPQAPARHSIDELMRAYPDQKDNLNG